MIARGRAPGWLETARAARPLPDQPDASGASGAPGASLYPGHVPLSPAQSALLTVAAGVGALVFPHRADLVGAVGETTGAFALRRMRDRMRADPIGADILARRPRITDATLEHAWSCPRHLRRRVGLVHGHPTIPTQRTTPRAGSSLTRSSRTSPRVPEKSTTCGTSSSTVPRPCRANSRSRRSSSAQTGMPISALSALFAPARLPPEQRKRLRRTLYPWAYRAGARAADLMCLDYEREFETGLDELRHKWRITPAPRE